MISTLIFSYLFFDCVVFFLAILFICLVVSTIGFRKGCRYRPLSDFAVGQRKVILSGYVLQSGKKGKWRDRRMECPGERGARVGLVNGERTA